MVRLVSENTDAEIAAKRALDEFEGSLAILTANLLRIVRGAGRSYDVLEQANSLLLAAQRYRDAAGVWPSSEQIANALDLASPDFDERWPEGESDFVYGKEAMIRGGLQVAASRLLGQRTQETAGGRELMEGFYLIEQRRETNRKRYAPKFTERKATKAKPAKRAKPAKPREPRA